MKGFGHRRRDGCVSLSIFTGQGVVLAQEYEVVTAGGAAVAAEDSGGAAVGLPVKVMLESLAAAELRVKSPIEVSVFATEGFILAEAVGFNEFGEGDSPEEAVADLQEALADLYFSLEGEQHNLGPWLQGVWQVLQGKVERR